MIEPPAPSTRFHYARRLPNDRVFRERRARKFARSREAERAGRGGRGAVPGRARSGRRARGSCAVAKPAKDGVTFSSFPQPIFLSMARTKQKVLDDHRSAQEKAAAAARGARRRAGMLKAHALIAGAQRAATSQVPTARARRRGSRDRGGSWSSGALRSQRTRLHP